MNDGGYSFGDGRHTNSSVTYETTGLNTGKIHPGQHWLSNQTLPSPICTTTYVMFKHMDN